MRLFACCGPLRRPLAILTTPWLAFPRADGPQEQERSHRGLYDQSHIVVFTVPHWLYKSALFSLGEDDTRV